jgi:uncharacterized protein YwqG
MKSFWIICLSIFCFVLYSQTDGINIPTILKSKPEISNMSKKGFHLITNHKGFSKIGGLPNLPNDTQWPNWNGEPLSFICQIKLSEISINNTGVNIPTKGLLYFFYVQDQSTWGFDIKDKGSWDVLFFDDEYIRTVEYKRPKGLKITYQEKRIASKIIDTFPSWENPKIKKLKLNDDDFEQYLDFKESVFDKLPQHLFLGYPSSIQADDMDLQSELVTNGLYCGNSTGYNDPKAKILEKNRDEWILLLQIDSDDSTKMMWGDCGMLYFWIKKTDLKNKDFSNVWMILQCG